MEIETAIATAAQAPEIAPSFLDGEFFKRKRELAKYLGINPRTVDR